MPQDRDDIRRHDDGAIDIRFYAERAVALRRAAKAEFMARAVAAIGRGWRALPQLLWLPRGARAFGSGLISGALRLIARRGKDPTALR